MSQSYKDFLDKYKIDDFKTSLKLTGRTKVDFFNDIDKLLKAMSTIFDKLAMIAPMRGAQVLLAVAKLTGPDSVVNKTDIKRCLNIDRLEKILSAIDYLEKAKYITIEKKTEKFHIIKLNEEFKNTGNHLKKKLNMQINGGTKNEKFAETNSRIKF